MTVVGLATVDFFDCNAVLLFLFFFVLIQRRTKKNQGWDTTAKFWGCSLKNLTCPPAGLTASAVIALSMHFPSSGGFEHGDFSLRLQPQNSLRLRIPRPVLFDTLSKGSNLRLKGYSLTPRPPLPWGEGEGADFLTKLIADS